MFSRAGGIGAQRNLLDPDRIERLHDLDRDVLAVAVRHGLERPATVAARRRGR
jgi:hypothetical protein